MWVYLNFILYGSFLREEFVPYIWKPRDAKSRFKFHRFSYLQTVISFQTTLFLQRTLVGRKPCESFFLRATVIKYWTAIQHLINTCMLTQLSHGFVFHRSRTLL